MATVTQLRARCQVCRKPLDRRRTGSMFDEICNETINPRRSDRHDPPGFEQRQADLESLHRQLRRRKPGWGSYDAAELRAMIAERQRIRDLRQ